MGAINKSKVCQTQGISWEKYGRKQGSYTEIDKRTIRYDGTFFFNFNDWDFIVVRNGWNDTSADDTQHVATSLSGFTHSSSDILQVSAAHTSDSDNDIIGVPEVNNTSENNGDDDEGHSDATESNEISDGCPACFLQPCITTNRQSWLAVNSARPHVRNTSIRKTNTKNFGR